VYGSVTGLLSQLHIHFCNVQPTMFLPCQILIVCMPISGKVSYKLQTPKDFFIFYYLASPDKCRDNSNHRPLRRSFRLYLHHWTIASLPIIIRIIQRTSENKRRLFETSDAVLKDRSLVLTQSTRLIC